MGAVAEATAILRGEAVIVCTATALRQVCEVRRRPRPGSAPTEASVWCPRCRRQITSADDTHALEPADPEKETHDD